MSYLRPNTCLSTVSLEKNVHFTSSISIFFTSSGGKKLENVFLLFCHFLEIKIIIGRLFYHELFNTGKRRSLESMGGIWTKKYFRISDRKLVLVYFKQFKIVFHKKCFIRTKCVQKMLVGRTDMFGRISSERHVRSYKLGQTHFVRAQLIMKYLTNFRLEYRIEHSCRNAISVWETSSTSFLNRQHFRKKGRNHYFEEFFLRKIINYKFILYTLGVWSCSKFKFTMHFSLSELQYKIYIVNAFQQCSVVFSGFQIFFFYKRWSFWNSLFLQIKNLFWCLKKSKYSAKWRPIRLEFAYEFFQIFSLTCKYS